MIALWHWSDHLTSVPMAAALTRMLPSRALWRERLQRSVFQALHSALLCGVWHPVLNAGWIVTNLLGSRRLSCGINLRLFVRPRSFRNADTRFDARL